MRIHKEGRLLIPLSILILGALWAGVFFLFSWLGLAWIAYVLGLAGFVLLLLVFNFFRNPLVIVDPDRKKVVAPCDGKVVAIEKVFEPEYFKEEVWQVSIFMSPLNVHVNRNPIAGVVDYIKYYPGKYLVAWHPKSSTENERTFVAIKDGEHRVAFKQIAGAVARRICWYIKEGDEVKQGEEMGFIRFGSRVDVLLPLSAVIKVQLEQKTKAGITTVAAVGEISGN